MPCKSTTQVWNEAHKSVDAPKALVQMSARCTDVLNFHPVPLNTLTNEMIPQFNVFAVIMEKLILVEHDGKLVVNLQIKCFGLIAFQFSSSSRVSQIPWQAAVLPITYFASHEDRETIFCFSDFHVSVLPSRKKKTPMALLLDHCH
jgi:hypothetical protein